MPLFLMRDLFVSDTILYNMSVVVAILIALLCDSLSLSLCVCVDCNCPGLFGGCGRRRRNIIPVGGNPWNRQIENHRL